MSETNEAKASSASLAAVKELRQATSAGIADCKKALSECEGDFEKAKDWLKQKGLSIANKKADRVAAEGLVAVKNRGRVATVIEVNAETDFVSKNKDFINFVSRVSEIAPNYDSLEDLKEADYGNGNTVNAELLSLISKVQENIVLRKFFKYTAEEGKLAHYVHGKVTEELGRIAVLVHLTGEGIDVLGKGIAMHIAGFMPLAISSADLDPALVEKETNNIKAELENVSKPQEVLDKMLEGKLNKYFKEVCLLNQPYLLDDKKTVAEVLKSHNTDLKFCKCISLGEDVEKKEEVSFADEVSKIIGG